MLDAFSSGAIRNLAQASTFRIASNAPSAARRHAGFIHLGRPTKLSTRGQTLLDDWALGEAFRKTGAVSNFAAGFCRTWLSKHAYGDVFLTSGFHPGYPLQWLMDELSVDFGLPVGQRSLPADSEER
jgi:hypothetical protein